MRSALLNRKESTYPFTVSKLNRKKKPTRHIELIFKGSFEELDELAVYEASFAKLSQEERLLEGWKMVEHAWALKGRRADELRFDRTVAVIKRP